MASTARPAPKVLQDRRDLLAPKVLLVLPVPTEPPVRRVRQARKVPPV